jgi:hypothetical protein
MITYDELWEKCKSDESITLEDIGIPSWRKDCDGFYIETSIGTCYNHKDGYRWANGKFLTLKECKRFDFEPGINNLDYDKYDSIRSKLIHRIRGIFK